MCVDPDASLPKEHSVPFLLNAKQTHMEAVEAIESAVAPKEEESMEEANVAEHQAHEQGCVIEPEEADMDSGSEEQEQELNADCNVM
jgi:hypothetical protein